MRLIEVLSRTTGVPVISKQEAVDRGMFGPVYHGTTNIEAILQTGFDPNRSRPSGTGYNSRPTGDGISNGYQFTPYGNTGIPAPIHHLGFAVYFTTNKAIAKEYNGGTMKGIRKFYLDVPRLEVINFAAPNTMMRWWKQNGYTMGADLDFQSWVDATDNLTNTLSGKYDAVWFKGKTLRRVLDGDQIAVFDPSRIYVVDPKLSRGMDIGAKVRHNQRILHYQNQPTVELDDVTDDKKYIGWKAMYRRDTEGTFTGRQIPLLYIPPASMSGVIVNKREIPADIADKFHGGHRTFVTVKWQKGGTHSNYYEEELTPVA